MDAEQAAELISAAGCRHPRWHLTYEVHAGHVVVTAWVRDDPRPIHDIEPAAEWYLLPAGAVRAAAEIEAGEDVVKALTDADTLGPADLAALHVQGARDVRGSALDRLTHAGKALSWMCPGPLEVLGADRGVDLATVRIAVSGLVFSFDEALEEVTAELAAIDHLAGRRCVADDDGCERCEEREVMERVAARESYLDGAADYAMDERKERAMERGL